ncbi:M13 family metallopeptidase [Nannocystis sp. SCPEA4]|uniref:M13 family metallopeptidase n=1 Tax=Nannocystis sp. SCPEA4 TaxID=2996787 RepID=UPI00226F98FD|nr:M13 family metallopeptidase [Nannocystis sp. SCPEA4]MCY1054668.1 M13 family metallopeptidase [Nannocystis sp. SCPEA4]
MTSRTRHLTAGLVLLAAACTAMPTPTQPQPRLAGEPSFEVDGMDHSVAPGDDFYLHANGAWQASTPIPADRPWFGVTQRMQDSASEHVRAIVADAARVPGSKIGDLYASFTDEATVARRGITPVVPWLQAIASAADHEALAVVMAQLARHDVGGLFGVSVGTDDREPQRNILTLRQAGLGLPDREFYLSDEPAPTATRTAYLDYLAAMLALAGEADSVERARAVLAFETALARAHWTAVDSRDAVRTYNKRTPAEVERLAPGFPWYRYLSAMGIEGPANLLIAQPSALTGEAEAYRRTPLPVLQDYMRLRVLTSYSRHLSPPFEATRFAFYGRVLAGTPEPLPRWRRGVMLVGNYLGDLVGQAYVARHFPPAAEAQVRELVADLIAALDDSLAHAAWMTPQTRARARAKLARTRVKIGYPSEWIDYAGLEIVRDDLVGNVARANAFHFARMVARLGAPPDPEAWLSPVTVPNAYASASANEIIFPAAVLQPPLFDPSADPASNYAGIGAMIGHELSHLFDDQGRKYDAEGGLGDWWTAEDERGFQAREAALVAQYDGYEPVPGQRVQGARTVGENIADLAGLELALAAYRRSLGGAGATIGGFTPEQRFFLGWARAWRAKYRDDALRTLLLSDAHAPGRERSWTVRNLDAWYAAFAVRPEHRLYLPPSQRVRFWGAAPGPVSAR